MKKGSFLDSILGGRKKWFTIVLNVICLFVYYRIFSSGISSFSSIDKFFCSILLNTLILFGFWFGSFNYWLKNIKLKNK